MQDPQAVFSRRFDARLDSKPAAAQCVEGGIVLSAVPFRTLDKEDQFALVLVTDASVIGAENRGASATNAMAIVLGEFAADVAQFADCPIQHILWIELDSMGHFDHVLPSWPAIVTRGTRPERVDWTPLHSPTRGRRTAEAFKAVWHPTGAVLLADTAKQLRCTEADFSRQTA